MTSSSEVCYLVGLAHRLGILIPADREALVDQYGQLIRALQALISLLRAPKPEV